MPKRSACLILSLVHPADSHRTGAPDGHRPEADIDVSNWRRHFWSMRETVREYSTEVWRKLNGEIERPWRVILVKPVNALRHRQHNVY